MFQVNLTHHDISDSSCVFQALVLIVQRHKAQNERQEACNARPYLDMVAKLEERIARLRANNDRRSHA